MWDRVSESGSREAGEHGAAFGARDVSQLVKCMSNVHEALGWSPAPHKPGRVANTCTLSGEVEEKDQGFKAILVYMVEFEANLWNMGP